MRKAISMLMILALTASLIGCGNKTTPTNTTTTNPPQATKQPAVLTSIFETSDGWVRNFNPFISNVYQFVQGTMYEPLVVFDSYNNNKEHMWLAEDIISEPDNKTLTVKV